MRRLIVALVAVSALGVLAVAAGSASAAFEWLCGASEPGGCVVLGDNLEAVVFEDMGVPASVTCAVGSIESEGSVLGAEGETKEIRINKPSELCTPSLKAENLKGESVINACKKVKNVEAENLPWLEVIEELVIEGTEDSYWILIKKGSAAGLPAFLVECEVAGIVVDDLCETFSESTTLLVLALNLPELEEGLLLVSDFFLKSPLTTGETWDCTVGGVENGLVQGEMLLLGMRGGLEASLEIAG